MSHSRGVSGCRLQCDFGCISVFWNDNGLLSRVDCGGAFGIQGGEGPFLAGTGVPDSFTPYIGRLREYLDQGDPLPETPWDKIDTTGMSEFQVQVYRAISVIPHGETRTYAWVAKRIGKYAAARAVGQALKKNPLPIIIPCHRVVAAETLGGFMGLVDENCPEMRLKRHLISLESTYVNPVFPFLAGSWMQPQGLELAPAAGTAGAVA